jgi:hypothetical protein
VKGGEERARDEVGERQRRACPSASAGAAKARASAGLQQAAKDDLLEHRPEREHREVAQADRVAIG